MRIIFRQQNVQPGEVTVRNRRRRNLACTGCLRRGDRHLKGEAAALPHPRADGDIVFKEVAGALDDREAQSQPTLPVAGCGFELEEFLEDLGDMLLRNARPRVPYLQPHHVAAAAHRHQHAALGSVADGIGQQVAHDLAEQEAVADDGHLRRGQPQAEPLLFRFAFELVGDLRQIGFEVDGRAPHFDDARIEL